MRAAVLLLACLLLLLPGPAAAEEFVRIAVRQGVSAPVHVEGKGLRARPLRDDGSYADLEGERIVVSRRGDTLLLDGEDLRATGVRLRAEGTMRVADKELRGSVEVLIEGRSLLVVNELAMEDYLAAVLGSEMPPAFPAEALKAQAVAARTYAVGRKLAAEGKPFHLGSTVLSQVYGGVFREDPRTKAAVDATRGAVLVFEHAPIEAYFFSSCGGRTAAGAEALGRPLAYLQPASCPEPRDAPGATWSLALDGAELGRRLGAGAVRSVSIATRTTTGRARTVTIEDGAGARTLSAVELRRKLGYSDLKSLAFEVARRGERFVFEGRGHGHGAGLCQWGARAMAERGKDHEAILAHYYPGAELRRMY